MTFDFIDDVVDMLDAHGYPYLIVIEHPKGQGAWVKSDLKNWVSSRKEPITIREDIH